MNIDDPILNQFIDDPKSLLEINTADISNEMSRQPNIYARVAYLYAIARTYSSNCKLAMDIQYSRLYAEVRPDNAEKTCDTIVKGHPEYVKIRQVHINAEHQELTIKAIMDGLQHKKDMLIQMGAMLRQEMITKVSVMEEQAQAFFAEKGGDTG